jgi:hypothetical protein
MQFSYRLLLLLIGTIVFTAGCTQGPGQAHPVTSVPVATPGLTDLALGGSEIPSCFSLTGQNVKSSGDVGNLAKELGWQAGYVATYSCPSNGTQPTVIVQSLAVYPAANMPGIASMVEKQDRLAGYTYEDMVFPDQGSAMRGFSGKWNETEPSGQSSGTYLVSSGREDPGPDTISQNEVAEVIFFRGTIFEVMRMTGPGTNVTVLRDMAQMAFAKIP